MLVRSMKMRCYMPRLVNLGEIKKECKNLKKGLTKLYRWIHRDDDSLMRAEHFKLYIRTKFYPIKVAETFRYALITLPKEAFCWEEISFILKKEEVAIVLRRHKQCCEEFKKLFKKKAWVQIPDRAFVDYVDVLCRPIVFLYSNNSIARTIAGEVVRKMGGIE